jgi:hypothetical protein
MHERWQGAALSWQKSPGPPGAVVEMQQSCSMLFFVGQSASLLQRPGASDETGFGRTIEDGGRGGGMTGPLASMPSTIGGS